MQCFCSAKYGPALLMPAMQCFCSAKYGPALLWFFKAIVLQ